MGILTGFWDWKRKSLASRSQPADGQLGEVIKLPTSQKDADYIPAQRVRADVSYVEISNRKKALGCELRMRLYLYDHKFLIITSVSGIAETGEPTVLPVDASNDDLGRSVCDHLLKFKPKSPSNMRDRKASDWGAYRASRAKSVRKFEEKLWMVRVETINSTLSILTSPRNTLWREIHAHGFSSPVHETLGSTIRRTLRAAMVLRDNGVI